VISDELAADLDALRNGAALVEPAGDLLQLSGPDRLRLLQGLVTSDVKSLPAEASTTGFFTTGQGRILADFRLFCFAESCALLLPSGTGETVRAHLEKYKVASRVEIFAASDRRLIELRGPLAKAAAVATRARLAAEDGDTAAVDGLCFHLLRTISAERVLGDWLRDESAPGLRRVGAAAVELARIEGGELGFGVDFSAENFPQETGREGDVSYTKGCYLGQEVVARIHYRGGVQRQPRGLRFTAGELPPAGAELLFEGRAVGRATSVALSPAFGAIGLGLLHQRGNSPGTRLEVAGGGEAEVVELPFGGG
jgi:folate-binding protein YgfZ